jgi:hypothetical protein
MRRAAAAPALIKKGLITDRMPAVLRCTDNNTYVHVIVTSKTLENLRKNESVEDLIQRFRDRQGTCRPAVDIISLDVGFEFAQVKGQGRRRKSCPDMTGPPTSQHILSDNQWRKHLMQSKALADCQRKLHTDEVTQRMSTCKPAEPTPGGRILIPIFVIEGPWGLIADNRIAN